MKTKLVMLMGCQRSGTNALFDALAADGSVASFNEHKSNDFYDDFYLKPLSAIQQLLDRSQSTVLLKPITETIKRSILDVFEEFRDYNLLIPFIYRDPVNVFYSHFWMHLYLGFGVLDAPQFIGLWNRRNACVLEALDKYPERVALVKYEDLIDDPQVFFDLCRFLGIRGKYNFRNDSMEGRRLLPMVVQEQLIESTGSMLAALNNRRSFRPHPNPAIRTVRKLRTRLLGSGC